MKNRVFTIVKIISNESIINNTIAIIGATLFATAAIIGGMIYYPKNVVKRVLDKYPRVVSTLETNIEEKKICLTFDDVPYGDSFVEILKVLDEYNIKATFFVILSNVNKDNKDIIVNAIKNGHEFSNHGRTNRMHTRLSTAELSNEIVSRMRCIIKTIIQRSWSKTIRM